MCNCNFNCTKCTRGETGSLSVMELKLGWWCFKDKLNAVTRRTCTQSWQGRQSTWKWTDFKTCTKCYNGIDRIGTQPSALQVFYVRQLRIAGEPGLSLMQSHDQIKPLLCKKRRQHCTLSWTLGANAPQLFSVVHGINVENVFNFFSYCWQSGNSFMFWSFPKYTRKSLGHTQAWRLFQVISLNFSVCSKKGSSLPIRTELRLRWPPGWRFTVHSGRQGGL